MIASDPPPIDDTIGARITDKVYSLVVEVPASSVAVTKTGSA